jgi:hypothetical protein
MIDLDKLYADFQTFLNEYDSEALDAWIEFDNNRLMLSKLLSGETVTWSVGSVQQKSPIVKASSGYKESFGDNYTYRLAA